MMSLLCPRCGSSRVNKSPSGQHLMCLDCQRVIVQVRVKEAAWSEDARQTSSSTPRALS